MPRFFLPILVLLLLSPLFSGTAVALESYKATYKLSYSGFHVGEAIYELDVDDDGNVLFKARVEPRGIASLIRNDIISEQSRLQLDDDGSLIAIRYEYLHERGRLTEEEKSIEFDWEAGQAISVVDEDEVRLDLKPGTVDRMSLQLKIMQDGVLDGNHEQIIYEVVEDLELRDYQFEVKGRSRIRTGAGSFDTLRLERRHGSRTTVFWCAPALDYLPVRVEQRRDGQSTSRMDMTAVSGPLAQ
jgi:hypothetical protein